MNATFSRYFQNDQNEWYLYETDRYQFDTLENAKKRKPEANFPHLRRTWQGNTKTEIQKMTFPGESFLVKIIIVWD